MNNMNQSKGAKGQQKFITQNEVNFHVQQQQQQYMKNFDGQVAQNAEIMQNTGQLGIPRRNPISSGPVSVQSSISQQNQATLYRQGSGNPGTSYTGMNRGMTQNGYAQQQQMVQSLNDGNEKSP